MKEQSWYRVELSAAECVKDGKADQLQKAFEVMFAVMSKPAGAALFEWFDERLETNVFYFSPGAVVLLMPQIEHLGGAACVPPLSSHWLVFLAGDERVGEGLESFVGDRR